MTLRCENRSVKVLNIQLKLNCQYLHLYINTLYEHASLSGRALAESPRTLFFTFHS